MLNTNPVQRPSAGDVLKAVQKHGALIKRKPVFLENNVTQRPRGCHSALYQFSIEQVTLTAVPEIPPDLNVKQVSSISFIVLLLFQLIVAKSHFLLLTTDSQVFSWGENTHGQLGHGDRKYRSIPSKIDALQGRDIQKIAAGANFSVFCADHGIVLICGHRDFVGSNNDTQDLLNPQLIDGLLRYGDCIYVIAFIFTLEKTLWTFLVEMNMPWPSLKVAKFLFGGIMWMDGWEQGTGIV